MIEHVVLLRWKPGTAKAAHDAAAAGVAALAEKVPGIVRCVSGPQSSPEGKGHEFDWGFVMTFVDAAARDAYLPHPDHQRVAIDLLRPHAADVLVFDFEHGS